MTEFRHKIAFIVPTRNRPSLVVKLLQNLQGQTVRANQVIIVDGSDQPIEAEIKQFLSPGVSYMRVFPPSLTKQRNEGLKALEEDITLAGYLDDDIVLERDAVEAMLRFWEHCPDDVGGSSFNITNRPLIKVNLFGKLFGKVYDKLCNELLGKLFCLDNGRQGVVLRSGFNLTVSPVLKDTYTEWLCGGATVWRRQVLEEFKYDERFSALAYYDDVDFSLLVGHKYKLVVQYAAKVQHLPLPLNLKKYHALARLLVQQRYYVVRKHAQLSLPLFYWATLGHTLSLILGSILTRSLSKFLMACGNISGLFDVIRGNPTQSDEELRKKTTQ